MTDTRTFTDPLTPAAAGAGWAWILAYGVLSLALGVLAFLNPFAATYAATLVIGAFFIAAGIVSLAAGVMGKHEGRGYAIGFGLLSLVIGVLMAFDPMSGALSLTLLVGVWLGIRGAMEIGLGARFKRGRGLMIALGVVNILLAISKVAVGLIGNSYALIADGIESAAERPAAECAGRGDRHRQAGIVPELAEQNRAQPEQRAHGEIDPGREDYRRQREREQADLAGVAEHVELAVERAEADHHAAAVHARAGEIEEQPLGDEHVEENHLVPEQKRLPVAGGGVGGFHDQPPPRRERMPSATTASRMIAPWIAFSQ